MKGRRPSGGWGEKEPAKEAQRNLSGREETKCGIPKGERKRHYRGVSKPVVGQTRCTTLATLKAFSVEG